MEEAVAFHIDGLKDDGVPIPAPETVTGYVIATG
jgi:predicted RNase H-like HicB family nuclease